MKTRNDLMGEIRSGLEDAAFLVSQVDMQREAHTKIVSCLMSLSALEALSNEPSSSRGNAITVDVEEVNRVQGRLARWAKRPDQINHRILKAYLEVHYENDGEVTYEALKSKVAGLIEKFDANFVQMKNIAPKNHGKVFEQIGSRVELWPPVLDSVVSFSREVFPEIDARRLLVGG